MNSDQENFEPADPDWCPCKSGVLRRLANGLKRNKTDLERRKALLQMGVTAGSVAVSIVGLVFVKRSMEGTGEIVAEATPPAAPIESTQVIRPAPVEPVTPWKTHVNCFIFEDSLQEFVVGDIDERF